MPPKKIVAIVECANGNESVGSMWLETKIFDLDTPVERIWDWGKEMNNGKGKLIITIESD